MSRLSLRSAIDAMCKACLYDPGNGNGGWREQVQRCSSSNCALHPVRPMPVKANKSAEDAHSEPLAPVTTNQATDTLYAPIVSHNDVISDLGRAA